MEIMLDRMNRLLSGLLLVASLLVGFTGCRKGNHEAVGRPNVLLISIDTLRADHLSCYGYERKTSARTDEIASEGVLFENCFSASCKTTPSHMSLMTALYPQVHDVYMWDQTGEGPHAGKVLPESIPTLAERLKEYGYRNVAFTGGGNVAARIGFGRGFDSYAEDDHNAAAVEWLKKNTDQPFFMFYHTYYTHDPYLPPPPYDKKFDPDYAGNIPAMEPFLEEMGINTNKSWHGHWETLHEAYWRQVDLNDPRDLFHLEALYDGCINNVDQNFIGHLLDTLRQKGVLDHTLVVITSDHGEEFLEHGRMLHDSLYREVTHIPLIMRLPGKLPAACRVKQVVRNIDIMPTILELLNLPCAQDVQGVSLLPAVTDDTSLDLVAYADFDDYAPPYIESVRTTAWFLLMDQRLAVKPDRSQSSSPAFMQVFNTARDYGETCNLVDRAPEETARLTGLLRGLRNDCARIRETRSVTEKPRIQKMDPSTIRKLKSLGYAR